VLDVLRIDESQAEPPPEPGNFVGRVRMQRLSESLPVGGLELYAVFFDAGAHARPHTHSTDQALLFVSGSGFVWLAGEERQRVPEGGIVAVPAGALHMHGATEGEAVCHLALRTSGPTDWRPEVPEEWRQFQPD
jgi:quercetin dioxygenase-like cupin family protein